MFPAFDGLYDKNIFKSQHTKSLYALLDRHFLLDVAEIEGNIQINRSSVKLHMMVVYLEVMRYTVMAVSGLSTLEGLGDEVARARTFASLMLRISDIFLRCIHRPSIYSVLSVYATQPRVCIPTIYDISGHGEPPSPETIAYERDLRAAKTSLQELMVRSGMSAVQMCDVFRGLKFNRSVRVIGILLQLVLQGLVLIYTAHIVLYMFTSFRFFLSLSSQAALPFCTSFRSPV